VLIVPPLPFIATCPERPGLNGRLHGSLLPRTFSLNARHHVVTKVYGALTTAGLTKDLKLTVVTGVTG